MASIWLMRRSTYAGLAVEDETKAFIFTRWASLQAHIDFTKSPLFDELKEALGPLLAGPLEEALAVEHVDFRKNPAGSLAAPITEIARFTLKAGHTKEQLVPLLDQLGEITTVPFVAQTWGWCVENNDQAVVAIGWKSLENLPESIRELNGKAQEHVDIAVVHAKLVAF
ncbi:hypothetical protein EWM64_g7938 [Hericium alpestre]|uniref:ABM domain-containing protein n=1 Tax=Hericium alpestre TaxID=135208 RepID=A0A4Y9ZP83_9AGAM|nr:hypothetical protein EWM64_g7938 [Hericium alpestre]